MKLKKQNLKEVNFEEMQQIIKLMVDLLEGKESEIKLEDLDLFQEEDGGIYLIEPKNLPREARLDFVNIPTYIHTAILMKEYLKGKKEIEEYLLRGLKFTTKSAFLGHGYDSENFKISGLKIFIKGGLSNFLEYHSSLYPEFNLLIHNILHEYNSKLASNNTLGSWGEDYKRDWKEIVNNLELERRLYLAYGSNMNKKQMEKRCPDSKIIGKGLLENWKLTLPFYANIEEEKGKKTPILVWEISSEDELRLDVFEGYPKAYDKKELLIDFDGRKTTGMAYIMTDDYAKLDRQVSDGYIDSIIEGYLDAGFKEDFKPEIEG